MQKVKKQNNIVVNRMAKVNGRIYNINNIYLSCKVPVKKKYVTYDTFENRFVKFILLAVLKRIRTIEKSYYILFSKRAKDETLVDRLKWMKAELIRRLENSFFGEVGELHRTDSMSLVLQMGLGYKDVFKYYLMLDRILTLKGEIFKISLKNISLLYEYWCFIKIISILKTKYNLIKQNVIQIDNSGIFFMLKKGILSQVEFENPQNGERILLRYNPFFQELPTVAQKPDATLSIEKKTNGKMSRGFFKKIF